MDFLATLLLPTHILAGFLCLSAGLLAIVLPKRGRTHRRVGRTFFWSMVYVNVSALLHITLVRWNTFLLVVAVLTFYQIFTGYRVLKRRQPGQQTWIDWTGALVSMVAGLGLLLYGLTFLGQHTVAVILCGIFGFGTFFFAARDVRWFLQPERITDKMWWFYHHLSSMMGAYMAAVTAFAVNAGAELIASTAYGWLLWLLPTVVLTPLTSYWKRSYQRKFAAAREQRAVRRAETPAEMPVGV